MKDLRLIYSWCYVCLSVSLFICKTALHPSSFIFHSLPFLHLSSFISRLLSFSACFVPIEMLLGWLTNNYKNFLKPHNSGDTKWGRKSEKPAKLLLEYQYLFLDSYFCSLVSDVVTLLRILCEGVAFNICIQSRKTSTNQ